MNREENYQDYQEQQYEESSEQQYDETPEQTGCINCGNPNVEPNYEVNLCKDCRTELYKRPFPILIKLVGVLIFAVVIVALVRFPLSLKAGIAYERGVRAEKDNKYETAMKEYKVVTKRFPDSTLALARLFIATYNNGYIDESYDIFDKIAGREPENDELVDEVNNTLDRLDSIYYISDDLNDLITKAQDADTKKAVKLYEDYLNTNPEDCIASYYYSNLLYDIGNLDDAKSVMEGILSNNPDFYDGQLLLAAIYRDSDEFDKAKDCCNIVIQHNQEYAYAYATLAKVELKDHNDKKGLELAKKAYSLDKKDSSVVATLAIAYHYNKKTDERDDMVEKFKKVQNGDTYDLDLMNGIFSDKIKWRD